MKALENENKKKSRGIGNKEERKKKDLFVWMALTPSGPTIKMHATNVHTMDELKMTGNCLKGSRPVLSFDATFDTLPHWQLLKEMFSQIFAVPKHHLKSKPFVDHAMTFSIIDQRVWIRNFQIVPQHLDKSKGVYMLAEIGPRAVLNPIKIFEGGFSGPILYENPRFVSPNALRRMQRLASSNKYRLRKENKQLTQERLAAAVLPRDEINEVFHAKDSESDDSE